jgi:uncharacterized protein YcbK (DUF882 family)
MRRGSHASALVLLAAVLLGSVPPALGAPRWRVYHDMVLRWHQPTPGRQAPLDGSGRPKLVLVSLNSGESLELPARSDEGGFPVASLERASWLLRDLRAGLTHPVEPALLDRVYQAQRHFQAQEVRVVSSYRSPGARGSGNHGRGRAMDLVLPGVSDKDLAAWAQRLGFGGVGTYPNAGYCHLDVRPASHFWVDRSGPGQRGREVPVLKDLARQADTDARRRGKLPVAYLIPSSRVDEAWRGAVAGGHDHEEGEEHE